MQFKTKVRGKEEQGCWKTISYRSQNFPFNTLKLAVSIRVYFVLNSSSHILIEII